MSANQETGAMNHCLNRRATRHAGRFSMKNSLAHLVKVSGQYRIVVSGY